jgi:phosphoribosylformylglycinamidine cyclo-ligase
MGVDIDASAQATRLRADAVRSTHTNAVLAGLGAFGGCFDLGAAASDIQVYEQRPDALGGASIGEALLAVHRSYLPDITTLWDAGVPLHALAHITGGVFDNLPRVLPQGTGALIRRATWDIPPICELLWRTGGLTEHEAFHTLNMGLAMFLVLPPDAVAMALQLLPAARLVGEIVPEAGVRLV